MVRGALPGPAPSGPCACQQLAAYAVELTDVPPAKAAQEGPQGGWRLDCAAENTGRPTGAQRIGVVDAVAASQRGGDQRQQLVPRVRPPRRAAEVEVMVDEFPQAQVPGEGGRQEQAGIGHQAVVIKGDADTVGIVVCQHLLGAPCFRAVLCSKTIIPDSEEHPPAASRLSPRPSLGGFGLRESEKANWTNPKAGELRWSGFEMPHQGGLPRPSMKVRVSTLAPSGTARWPGLWKVCCGSWVKLLRTGTLSP